MRWDLQTFRTDRLETNPAWPASGKVPHDRNNIAPRVGFAYSLGEKRPLVLRGGYGIFYTRIPQLYNSAGETDNGLAQSPCSWTTPTSSTTWSSPRTRTRW